MGQLVEPVIRPFRRFNLQFMGLDFTILAVVIALNVLSRILIMILRNMAMQKDLYQHFRPGEYDFIEKIDDLARRVEVTYAYALTDFLNPRQVDIARSVIGNRGLHYLFRVIIIQLNTLDLLWHLTIMSLILRILN